MCIRDRLGFCLFDYISEELQKHAELVEYAWERREIENYIVFNKQVLIDWAHAEAEERTEGPLFSTPWMLTIEQTIVDIEKALATLGQESPWSSNTKVSTDFLDPLISSFFKKLELPNLMQKTNYYTLVKYVPTEQIDPEVTAVLDAILEVANRAKSLISL